MISAGVLPSARAGARAAGAPGGSTVKPAGAVGAGFLGFDASGKAAPGLGYADS